MILRVQNIFEEDLGSWFVDALPAVGHLMIIAGRDHHVTRIIWDMADPKEDPYGGSKVRVIVTPCDGKIEHAESTTVIEQAHLGDYVLATKYSDADPMDAWRVGFVVKIVETWNDTSRSYIIGEQDGTWSDFREYRHAKKISLEEGRAWLAANAR